MLFEPCGDLRKDYGAYCETLRLTEREELYSGFLTTDDRREAAERQRTAIAVAALTERGGGGGGGQQGSVHVGVEDLFGRRSSSRLSLQAGSSTTPGAAEDAAGGGGEHGGEGGEGGGGSSSGRKGASAAKKKSKKEVKVEEVPEAPEEQWVDVPPLTFISLRHPKFCINQRDATPMCRAMPHCPSLVEVVLVGCGLSLESYLQLVEAIYRCPRVVTAAVDFNCVARPGFYDDPTAPPPPPAALAAPAGAAAASDAEASTTTPAAPSAATAAAAAGGGGGGGKAGKRKTSVKSTSGPAASAVLPSAAGAAAGAGAGAAAEDASVLLLRPSEYCGQCNEPSALEEQIQEEREKKGKVDPKKLQAQQAQQEALAQFDQAHPIRAPRSWAAALLTGVRSLSLRGNGIGDAVARQMADLLVYNPRTRLVSLNLWGNEIGDDGARELARALQANTTLRALDLGHNRVGDEGCLALVDAFRVREIPTLEEAGAYRQRVLLRPTATPAERQAAHHAMPTPPSYQELYQLWHAKRYPPPPDEKKEGKRAGKKSKADTLVGVARPTAPFDRECVRLASDGGAVRVPGNATVEVLLLGGNPGITLEGMEEAARRLGLREPAGDEAMEALALASLAAGVLPPEGGPGAPAAAAVSLTSPGASRSASLAAPAPPAAPPVPPVLAVLPPERHTAPGMLRLRSLVLYSPSYANAAEAPAAPASSSPVPPLSTAAAGSSGANSNSNGGGGRGWDHLCAAQARINAALDAIARDARGGGSGGSGSDGTSAAGSPSSAGAGDSERRGGSAGATAASPSGRLRKGA